MKVLIIGAGRMGIRHLQGALQVSEVISVMVLDIKQEALDIAKDTVENNPKVKYCLLDNFNPETFDVCIIASTAGNRKFLCELAARCNCKNVMIEKPLGQSYAEVEELVSYLDTRPYTTAVNLNMRLYQPVRKLKSDLALISQLQGEKNITLNTGTLGIGCNGIHYLDFIYFILDANRAEIAAAEVDDTLIPSGRGPGFCDFGGWAVIKYYRDDLLLGTALFSMSAKSTVFGGWEIVAPFGRISIDEIAQKRITSLRKGDSSMPMNRYAADYLSPEEEPFIAPFLGDLTAEWIKGLINGINLLPKIKESLKVHQLMFDWLSHSKTHKEIFPIT